MFKGNCLEGLAGLAIGAAAMVAGYVDPGVVATAGIGLSAIFARFRENAASRGLDAPDLIERMRLRVFRDLDKADDTAAMRDARVEADMAMTEALPKIAITRQLFARTSTQSASRPFRDFASEVVVDLLAAENPIFAAPADPEAELSLQRTFALTVVRRALDIAMEDTAYAVRLTLDLTIETNRKLSEMSAALADEARRRNISEEALMALARGIEENVPDVGAAIIELTRALDEFVRIRDRRALGSNLDDLVAETMRGIDALNRFGHYRDGAAQAERAMRDLDDREAKLKAQRLALIDITIDQYRLAYDAAQMAHWLGERERTEQGALTATSLFPVIKRYRALALTRGLRLEMDVAISLSERAVAGAVTDGERGDAANWLGLTASDQGERSGGEAGQALLAKAVEAYTAALRIYTEQDMPADWAMTQTNLGIALIRQGECSGGKAGQALLARAVDAHGAALRVYTEQDMPVQWAMTQNNLALALRIHGQHSGGEAGQALLARAIDAYRAALRVCTEQDMPAEWAMMQNNLGIALMRQGERSGGEVGEALLAKAVEAYRAALRVRTQHDMPVPWAMTRGNMAFCFEVVAERSTDKLPHLRQAESALLDALRIFTLEHMPYDHGKATTALARIRAWIADIEGAGSGLG